VLAGCRQSHTPTTHSDPEFYRAPSSIGAPAAPDNPDERFLAAVAIITEFSLEEKKKNRKKKKKKKKQKK
jgi:hypothetical protein